MQPATVVAHRRRYAAHHGKEKANEKTKLFVTCAPVSILNFNKTFSLTLKFSRPFTPITVRTIFIIEYYFAPIESAYYVYTVYVINCGESYIRSTAAANDLYV